MLQQSKNLTKIKIKLNYTLVTVQLTRYSSENTTLQQALTGGGHGDWHSADEHLWLMLLHLRLLRVGCGRGSGLHSTATRNAQQILRRLLGRSLAISCRNGSLPPPFDESHAVPDGLAHNLHITVEEKT